MVHFVFRALLVIAVYVVARRAQAQTGEAPPPPPDASGEDRIPPSAAQATTPPVAAGGPTLKVTPLGYVEAFYQWNFNVPSNGLTNYRGFDNRHDSFTLSNVALGATMEYGELTSRIVLQIGHTPNTYYLGEPVSP